MLDGDGEPIVMDFGVARRADDGIQFTTPGRLVGTPAYMSPEQVEADPSKIGPATDIYSLGVLLFVLLTGRVPFNGTLTSVLRQIGNDEPPRPSALNPEITAGAALERICLKMMAKSPADRFASMAAVADALEQPVAAETAPASAPSLWRVLVGRSLGLFASRKKPPAPADAGTTFSSSVTPRADAGEATIAQ